MIALTMRVISAFVLVDGLIGFILNTVILAINLRDWTKGARLQPFHYIHIVMALVNILLQCAVVLGFFMGRTPLLDDQYKFNAVFISMSFLFFLCFWLNACLCAYYLTSIASFNHHFFAWLKTHFSAIIPKFILVAAVGSFIVSFSGIWKVSLEKTTGTYDNLTMNSVAVGMNMRIDPVYLLISSCLGCFIPFTLSSLCLGYTLMHILSHVCRIKFNSSGSARPNLQAHARAARTMIWIFLLSLSLHLAQAFQFVSSKVGGDISLLSSFLTLSFPVAQALIIIQSSAKLRQRFQFLGHFGNVCNEKAGLHRKS